MKTTLIKPLSLMASIMLLTVSSAIALDNKAINIGKIYALNEQNSHIITHKEKSKIAFTILHLQLIKANISNFNYAMNTDVKNIGTETLDGQYLKKSVFIKENNKWVYLNGSTTPGLMYAPGARGGASIPINIQCKAPNIMLTHVTAEMRGKRDFLVTYTYKGVVLAKKELPQQAVCVPNRLKPKDLMNDRVHMQKNNLKHIKKL